MNIFTYSVTFRHTTNENKVLKRPITTEEVKARNVVSAMNTITKLYQEVEIIECRIETDHGSGKRIRGDKS